MSEDRELQQAELEAERQLRASVHRWLGVLATVLVVVAIIVAVWRLNVSLAQNQQAVGISLGQSMGMMFSALPWVLLIVAVGVVFSMGTTRLLLGLEKLVHLITGKKAGK